ncbi:MAG: hypothetical protein K1X52_14015 [Pyrinomonadaceae bacterium]|nr:hypothetical protein [Pyrinomonadaceae bacterium]
MKIIATILLTALAVAGQQATARSTGSSGHTRQMRPPSPFTYQGKLIDNSTLATGNFDFLVYVCSNVDPLVQPATSCEDSQVVTSIPVQSGIFTIQLDPNPSLFDDHETMYLEIQVRQSNSGNAYTALTPRQQITATPYATSALNAKGLTCTNCVGSAQVVSVPGSKITGSVANATNAVNATNATNAGYATNAGTAQYAVNAVDLTSAQTVGGNKTFTGILSGNGSGLLNVPGTLKWNVSSATSVQMQSNNGYILTNGAATTVTLPASPAVGDVVRVMAKGAAGFTLAMNSGQSILDWATSHQETIWTRPYWVNSSTNTNLWGGAAVSNDGTKLAAVEYPGYIVTSNDGAQTWTYRMQADVRSYASIASSSDGTKLIAGVADGHLFTSADSGVNWTERFTDANRYWYSVAVSADGSTLVAADMQGIYTSTNGGATWIQRRTISNHYVYVAVSSNGTKLVYAENLGHVYTSTDSGATWIDRLSGTNNQWQAVASSSDGTKLVAVERPGKVWVSSNSGATWTGNTLGPAGVNTNWSGASMSADGARIAVTAAGSNGLVLISYNGGTSWTTTGVDTNWTTVSVAGNGNFMAAGMSDGSQNRLYSGPISTTTIVDSIAGPKDSAVELVYIGSNQFVMVSKSGAIALVPNNY